jgi:multicomponent Na+:H+ antiporter subunit E
VRIPDGPRRAAFGAFTSLMPGTLPVGTDRDGSLVYHCLDLEQPITASLARDEALVTDVQGGDWP